MLTQLLEALGLLARILLFPPALDSLVELARELSRFGWRRMKRLDRAIIVAGAAIGLIAFLSL